MKTLKVETGKCVVESFIDILDTIMSHFASSPDKTDVFFLNIFAGDLTVQTKRITLQLQALDFTIENMTKGTCKSVENQWGKIDDVSFTYSKQFQKSSDEEFATLFDEEQIYMYKDEIRPNPLSSKPTIRKWFTNERESRGLLEIQAQYIALGDITSFLQTPSHQQPSDLPIAIELFIRQGSVQLMKSLIVFLGYY